MEFSLCPLPVSNIVLEIMLNKVKIVIYDKREHNNDCCHVWFNLTTKLNSMQDQVTSLWSNNNPKLQNVRKVSIQGQQSNNVFFFILLKISRQKDLTLIFFFVLLL